ncbi:MAG: NDP-hexose 2,3-dehydratase family protein [Actinobacteria bacterium]|nr:NDP-hexose 2,3-dehydratase family protein [Actinomycetota bacterium]
MSLPLRAPDLVAEWRNEALEAARFSVRPMPLSRSEAWSFTDGALRHRSGRFFAIVGARERSGAAYPLIDQQEIGTLGFVVTGPPDDVRWLTRMNVEPGNVGGAQVGPTMQATRSNLDRVHDGPPPPLADLLTAARMPTVADGLWSEQGSRFFGKRNRNLTFVAPEAMPVDGLAHRWLAAADLRRALGEDFAVNTDARSVVATAPWRLIASGTPFSGELRTSYEARDRDVLARVRRALDASPPRLQRVPLDLVDGIALGTGRVPVRHDRFDVVHVDVVAVTREVPRWDQPMVSAHGIGTIELRLRRGPDGILRAMLGIDRDAGLVRGPEATATVVVAPGGRAGGATPDQVIAAARVSDEGGRFFRAVSDVMITITGDAAPPAALAEVTLGDLEALVRAPMATTNELRTAVALLLSLA